MEFQFNSPITDITGSGTKHIKPDGVIPLSLVHEHEPEVDEALSKEVLLPVQPQHEPLVAHGFDVAGWGVHQAALLLEKNSDDIVAIPASARGHLGAVEAFDIIDVHEGNVDTATDPVFLVQISVYRDQFNRNRLHIQEYEQDSKDGEKLAQALRETFETHLATQEVIEKADTAAREHLQLPLGTLTPGEKKNKILKKLYTFGAVTTIGVTTWQMANHVTNGNWFLSGLAGAVASIPFWISRYRSQQRHNVSALVEEISGTSFKKRDYDDSVREMFFGSNENRNLKALKTVVSIEKDPAHLVALSRLIFVCALNKYPLDQCRSLLKLAEKRVPEYGIERDEIGTLIDALEQQPAFDSGPLKQPYFDNREHLIRHIQKNAIRSNPEVIIEANQTTCAGSQTFDQLDNLSSTLALGLGLLPSDVTMILSPKGAYPWAKVAFEFCEIGQRAAQISPDGKLPVLQVLEFQTKSGDPKLLIKPFDHPYDAGLKVIRAAREVLDEYAIDASGSLKYLYRLPGKNRSFMGNRTFAGLLRKLSVLPYAGSITAFVADCGMILLTIHNAAHMTPELSKQIAAQVSLLYPLRQCIDLPRTLWQSCAAISKRREIFDKGASLYSNDENKKMPELPYVDGTDFKGLVYEAEHTSRSSRLLEIARIARAVSLFKLAHRQEGQWLSNSIRLCRRIELSFPHGSEHRQTVSQYISEMETLSSENSDSTSWYGYDYTFEDL